MVASNSFVENLLDVIDKTANSAGFNNAWRLQLVRDIAAIPEGNQSVKQTQVRLLAAAHERWI